MPFAPSCPSCAGLQQSGLRSGEVLMQVAALKKQMMCWTWSTNLHIHTDHTAILVRWPQRLACDLKPGAWRAAQIQTM